jgi:hypothetical protein
MASSGRSGLSYIFTAFSNFGSIGQVLVAGFMGVILAWASQGINAIVALTNIFITPVSRLGANLGQIVDAFVGGGARIIAQGVETAVLSTVPGAAWAIGPLTFATNIIAAGAGLFAMAWLLSQAPTSNLIPFSFTDFPLIGVDEEEEGDE